MSAKTAVLVHEPSPRRRTSEFGPSYTRMKKPISLCWSGGGNSKINYGDLLSKIVVERLTGRQVTYASASSADLAAIGSIFHEITRYQWRRPFVGRLRPLIVWGSGSIRAKPIFCSPFLDVRAVRGPLTRDKARLPKNLTLGDPGLLAPMIFDSLKGAKKYKFGIIPHVVDFQNPLVNFIQSSLTPSTVINLRNPDVKVTTHEIAACELVVSSSLHGLIIADAFGIPNLRIKLSDNIIGGDWKFLDYFRSVGREEAPPGDIFEVVRQARCSNIYSSAERSLIGDISERLLKEFAKLNF